jgi:hypothetical protein
MKYYINKKIYRAAVFLKELPNTGTSEKDYKDGKWIEINESQADFYKEHPNISFHEIMNMAIDEVSVQEIPIMERYKARVEELMNEKYSEGTEIRILFNGSQDPSWAQHEQDAAEAKAQAKKELGIDE